ncbi:hypothetical protein NL108_011003 [Boleophthalmus pectinirostris]|nr:hypothetical protein NL108_011003 [Boleophthalmus pectinirostris]
MFSCSLNLNSLNMKSLQIAVLLLVLFIGTLEALVCHRCIQSYPGARCYNTVETCSEKEVCGSFINHDGIVETVTKRCMTKNEAANLNSFPLYQVFTCATDLCN